MSRFDRIGALMLISGVALASGFTGACHNCDGELAEFHQLLRQTKKDGSGGRI